MIKQGGGLMVLGMSGEDTLKKLLSEEMYNVYVGMARDVVALTNNSDTRDGLTGDTVKGVIQDVTIIGALILNKSIEYTPVDTGRLRSSIYIKGIGTGIVIGYSVDYAVYVHELGIYKHKSPTRYKFLEDAAFEVALETGTPYRVSISYSPLEVYVNVPNMGTDLISIKAKSKLVDNKNKVWDDFVNYDDGTANESERLYHNKIEQLLNY